MQHMGDFIGSFWFFVIGGLLLVGLIVLFFVIRNKREED
jgi:LPXTG-motif cell wall-anchored protein